MVEEHEADDARALVIANIRPPRLIAAPSRERVGDQIVVFSHVELWPWRIVLRGALANEAVRLPEPDLDSEQRDRFFADGGLHRWMTDWQATDDLGSDYRFAGSGGGGSGGDLWMDFHVQFDPAPPENAKRLTFTRSDGIEVHVEVSATA